MPVKSTVNRLIMLLALGTGSGLAGAGDYGVSSPKGFPPGPAAAQAAPAPAPGR